jgi:hypothetical protein
VSRDPRRWARRRAGRRRAGGGVGRREDAGDQPAGVGPGEIGAFEFSVLHLTSSDSSNLSGL